MSLPVSNPLASLFDHQEWRDGAACSKSTLDFMALEDNENVKALKEVCGVCPVTKECLEYALKTNPKYGLWGGKMPTERHRIRAERARKKRRGRGA